MSMSQGIRLVTGLVAAGIFVAAAQAMDIHSQAGTSIDEAFYQAMGMFSYAMAALSITVSLPVNPGRGDMGGQATGPASAPPPSTLNPPPE